jgi:hypothetical protein
MELEFVKANFVLKYEMLSLSRNTVSNVAELKDCDDFLIGLRY